MNEAMAHTAFMASWPADTPTPIEAELSIAEAARRLDVTPTTVRNWIDSGRLRGRTQPARAHNRRRWTVYASSVRAVLENAERERETERRTRAADPFAGPDTSPLIAELRADLERVSRQRDDAQRQLGIAENIRAHTEQALEHVQRALLASNAATESWLAAVEKYRDALREHEVPL